MVKKKYLKPKLKNIKNYIFFGICGILAIVSIFLTIETATSGIEISRLQKTELSLDAQKRTLEETLVKEVSLSDLQEKSGEMGFIKPANLVYVTSSESVAKLP